jgi:hypothetical protein
MDIHIHTALTEAGPDSELERYSCVQILPFGLSFSPMALTLALSPTKWPALSPTALPLALQPYPLFYSPTPGQCFGFGTK